MTEARKADRLRIVLLARYREPTMLDLREAECRDISLGGMFVATARPSPRGGLIRFECESSAEGESFRGTARVVWQRSKPDPRGPAGMGVRFVHLEPSSREALSRLVARVSSSNKSIPVPGSTTRREGPGPSAPEPRAAAARDAFDPRAAATRDAPAEEQTAVVPIVGLGSTQHGMGPGQQAHRSPLHAPTLRGVGSEPEVSNGGSRRLDRGAVRRSVAPERPERAPATVAPITARVRTDPPPNLVSNPDRPRSDRPPAAGPVDDEPAWSRPRAARRGSERPPAPGVIDDDMGAASERSAASASDRPLGTSPSDRPMNATAPGVGGPGVERLREDETPIAPVSALRGGTPIRTLMETRESASAKHASAHAGTHGATQDKPARERLSERPPAPGGVDVLRVQTVVRLPSAAIGDGTPAPTSENAAIWHGQRASTDPGQPPARTSWEPPPSAITRKPVKRAAEEAEIVDEDSVPRLPPPRPPLIVEDSVPPSESSRSWGTLMLWLVIGSGLIVTVVLSKLLGGASPSIPDSAAAIDQTDTFGAQPGGQGLALPYRLVVLTDPPGAKVTVGATTLVSPAEFGLPAVSAPVQVRAAIDGRMPVSIEVTPAEFVSSGDHFEHEVKLSLPAPIAPPAQEPPAEPAPAPLAPVPAPTPSPRAPRAAITPPAPAAQAPVVPAAAPPLSSTPAALPFGAPVLPNRPQIAPPGSSPTAVPASSSASAPGSAVGTPAPISITPSADVGAQATECLRKGDNACVIRLLESGARTPQELEMLIETYRAIGDQGNAERHMKRYVEAFPGGHRAAEYTRLLSRSAPAGSAPQSSAPPSNPMMSVTPSNPQAPPMPPEPPPAP